MVSDLVLLSSFCPFSVSVSVSLSLSLCLCLCLSSEVSLMLAGAEQLYQVKRMQRNRTQWFLWWTSGASDNFTSAMRWTWHWVKVSPLIRNHRGRWFISSASRVSVEALWTSPLRGMKSSPGFRQWTCGRIIHTFQMRVCATNFTILIFSIFVDGFQDGWIGSNNDEGASEVWEALRVAGFSDPPEIWNGLFLNIFQNHIECATPFSLFFYFEDPCTDLGMLSSHSVSRDFPVPLALNT